MCNNIIYSYIILCERRKAVLIILPTAGAVTRFLVGVFSDVLVKYVNRHTWIMVASIMGEISIGLVLLGVYVGYGGIYLILGFALIGSAEGILWCMLPTVISLTFGVA